MAGALDTTIPAPAERVSTLELFFDLVFVFTVTQLTAVLTHDLSWSSLGQVMVMLALIWWMYGGYAWLTNAISTRGLRERAILLGGMAGYLLLALSIPDAFHGSGLAFGAAYLLIVSVHASLFIWAASAQSSRAFLGIAPYNLFTGVLVLVGGALGGTAEAVLWTAAALIEWFVTTRLAGGVDQRDFEIFPAHFVERHGLVVIVAIGESVVAIGIGAADLAVDAELVLVAVLGLLLCAGLWWAYFGADDDEKAERAMSAAPAPERAVMALVGFGRAHYFLLLGIVLTAAGLKKATGHPYDELTLGEALTLGGGVALFLAADVWFRRLLGLGRAPHRAAAALLALATVPLGTALASVAQLGALVVILAATLAVEGAGRR
ncbi:MAG TPA: low temperature requirement protein A [Solirubrobacteraceae bacterium]|nr:low temperature requirement protein A [Solirubrobacteraceae bacterium]